MSSGQTLGVKAQRFRGHTSPPPAPVAPRGVAPPMQQGQGGMMSGLMGTVATGAALGTGSAMAHHAVDGVMGMFGGGRGREAEPQAAAAPAQMEYTNPCQAQAKNFADCMSNTGGDMGACEPYFNAMQQCKMNLQGQ
eukprot:TRINITY_DN4256_c0_g1_i5.p2 TRINITY_DN4256_c0_g1~~TRINITY_DN4256_c0_g1_i5.p2  ORF type:complete len:137 (-),score=50.70 TRINITY_DN4256_c0_g1_i5:249-659(-)